MATLIVVCVLRSVMNINVFAERVVGLHSTPGGSEGSV